MKILEWMDPTRWLMAIGMAAALWFGYMAWADHQQGIGYDKAQAEYAVQANAGDYAGACRGYLEYKFIRINGKPYDCSTPGNRVCSGVWKRSVGRYDKCMGDQ